MLRVGYQGKANDCPLIRPRKLARAALPDQQPLRAARIIANRLRKKVCALIDSPPSSRLACLQPQKPGGFLQDLTIMKKGCSRGQVNVRGRDGDLMSVLKNLDPSLPLCSTRRNETHGMYGLWREMQHVL